MAGKDPSEHHEDCFLCSGTGEWLFCAYFGQCETDGDCRYPCNCNKNSRGWTEKEVYSGYSTDFWD